MVKKEGRRCLVLKLDVRKKSNCEELVQKTVQEFGHLDVLVNNGVCSSLLQLLAYAAMHSLQCTFLCWYVFQQLNR